VIKGVFVEHSAAESFVISSQLQDRQLVVAVRGELDLATVEEFRDALEQAATSDAERIVVDLANLSFIDSRGITALLEANAASRQDGDRLRFHGASGQVARALSMTGVDKALSADA
jgi:anti-sigma B factor antagonist